MLRAWWLRAFLCIVASHFCFCLPYYICIKEAITVLCSARPPACTTAHHTSQWRQKTQRQAARRIIGIFSRESRSRDGSSCLYQYPPSSHSSDHIKTPERPLTKKRGGASASQPVSGQQYKSHPAGCIHSYLLSLYSSYYFSELSRIFVVFQIIPTTSQANVVVDSS